MSTDRDRRARQYWHALNADEQKQAIRNMAALGASDFAIAAATHLAVEQIRQVLGERRDPRNRLMSEGREP